MDETTIQYTDDDHLAHEKWLLSIWESKNFRLIPELLVDNEDDEMLEITDTRPTLVLKGE